MHLDENEEKLLRAVAIQNAKAVLVARERAELELGEANQRITNILATITDGFVALDEEWRFVFVNQRAEEMLRPLQKTRSMLLGRNHWEIFPETVGTPLEHQYRTALRDQVTVHFESFYPPLDAWFEIRAYPSPKGLSIYFQNISERKKAGEALLASEQQLRAIFNQAAVGIALTELDGRFAQVNRKFCEILGYSPQELRQMKPLDITHPDDVARTRDLMRQLVTGEIPHYVIEKRYLHKEGREIWSLSTITLIKDAAGRPERLIGIIEDITARKQAEQELKGSSDRLHLALIAGGLGDWEWETATDQVLIGQRTAEIFGISHEPISWTRMRGLLHEEDQERARMAVERALADRTDYNIEYRVVHPGGKVVWVASRGRGRYGTSGEALGMIGVVADITQRKLAEETRSRLAAVVESSDDAIISMDFGARITTWNKGAEHTFGYTAEEIVGKSITLLIPPSRENEEPALLERLKRGERIEHYETERMRKDGKILHVSLSVSPVYDANGAIVGVSKISRDITARKQTEAELRRAQEELSQHADVLEKEVDARTASLREAIAQLEEFSYSVSHDLRAPLRAIAGYTQLFEKDFGRDLPPAAHVFLDKISRSTERMQRLVNDVLTMSLVARSETSLHPVALQHFIQEIVEQHPEMQAPEANISIATPHKVIADEAPLGQAVRNLLANAVKFVAPGTRPVIVVRSEQRDDRVRIWFEDNGIGINPEHRGKLFGMFQRLITDSKYEGTGIGLAIVRKAIERMGGTVGVEAGEKAGSRFWVELKGSA
jgi:PAS domain S-box-containing protein